MKLEDIALNQRKMTDKEMKIGLQDLMLDYLIKNKENLDGITLKNIRDMVASSTATNSDEPWIHTQTIHEVAEMANEWRQKQDSSEAIYHERRVSKPTYKRLMDTVFVDSGFNGPVCIHASAEMDTKEPALDFYNGLNTFIQFDASKNVEMVRRDEGREGDDTYRINGKDIEKPDGIRYFALVDKNRKVELTATVFDYGHGDNRKSHAVILNRYGSPMIDDELRGYVRTIKEKMNIKEAPEQPYVGYSLGRTRKEQRKEEDVKSIRMVR